MLKINPKEKAINKIKTIDLLNFQGLKYIVIDVSFCKEKIRAEITPITKNLLINSLQKSVILSLLYIFFFPKKIYTRR
jgi:hypothetical protein